MRRLLVVAVALLVSGLVVTSTVQVEPSEATEPQAQPKHFITVGDDQFPAAGWWKVGGTVEKRTIYRSNRIRTVWILAYVYPYRHVSDVPLYWRAHLWITNIGDSPVIIRCSYTDPSTFKEHIRRGGEYIGYVAAERTFCSEHPNYSRRLWPGQTSKESYALFHNVPWRGDKVSIEPNRTVGRSTRFVNPWGRHQH